MEEQKPPQNDPEVKKWKGASDREYYLFALKIVGDFGASIAVPVALLALVGRYFDRKYDVSPWLTIIGFALAALISAKIIYRRAKEYGKQYQKLGKK